MPETTWQPVSEIPSLLANEVHIWRIWLNRPDEEVAAGQSLLSPDELARAARFYFDRDRRRYILARGHLRRLLAHYLNAKPMAIRFQYAAQGKPQLAGDADIQFNVSHAQDVALIGLCRGTALGVDVEWVRPLSDMDAVAHRSFSQMEYDEYRGMPEKMKPAVFFNCWTRKEAFIKAVGEGLSYPLRDFAVTLLPDEPVQFRHIRESKAAATEWTLQSFCPAIGYAGALALKGTKWLMSLFAEPQQFLH